jgi:hypothetical protein
MHWFVSNNFNLNIYSYIYCNKYTLMHLYAYINLDTYFLCLNCGRSLDFFLASKCVQLSSLKRDPYLDRTRSLGFFLDYSLSLIALIAECFDILVSSWPTQRKNRRVILFFTNKFSSSVQRVIGSSEEHYSLLFRQILKSSSWLIRKKSQSFRDLNTSREDRFKYYPEVSPGIEAKQLSALSNNKNWRRTLHKYQSMRAEVMPSPVKQFFKTLSLRRFAYEFAQHKEVPGDQLKPSKERIKNVTTRNQQCRCKSLLQN